MKRCLMSLALCACFAVAAEEVGDLYGSLSYSRATIQDTSGLNLGTYHPTTLSVGLSVIAIKHLALDGYVFQGYKDTSNALDANTAMTLQVKQGYGFNLHPYLPLSYQWGLYAKLGRQFGTSETVIRQNNASSTTSAQFATTVYGLGVSRYINSRWQLDTDYTKNKHQSDESTRTTGITVSLSYKL